ncbi:MAG: PKD domain-containing protein, partial [Bacteroidales bacterium]
LFSNDTLHLCEGNILHADPNLTNIVHYLWQPTGDTLYYTTVLNSDFYSLSIENANGCTQRDSVFIHILGKAPIVNFSASHTCLGDSTYFTDLSTSADTSIITFWQWIIDGDTLLSQNPTFAFSNSGIFPIQLTVGTSQGCKQFSTQNVHVFPLPSPDFSVYKQCSHHESYFSSQSTIQEGYINRLTWLWGDGSYSYDTDTVHIYNNSGIYEVKLIAESNEGCIDSISKNIEIKPSPIAGFDVSPSCANNFTFFTDTSVTLNVYNPIIQWEWFFGDGTTSNSQHPTHVYQTAGYYNVALIIKSLNGCIDSTQKNIIVSTKPHANFSADSACLGQPIYLQDLSDITNGQIIEWNWYVHTNFFSSQQNPIYIPSEVSTLPITLIVKSNTQCTDTFTKSIVVYPLPNVQFDLNPNYGAFPLSVEFINHSDFGDAYWNFGDNSFSTQTNPLHTFQDTGLYYVWLTQTNIHGCKDSTYKTVLVVPNLLDLAIEKISYTTQSDYIFVQTQLSNVGTLPIENPVLTLVVEGQVFFSEIVYDTIFSGEKRNYTFNAILPITEGFPRYLCVNGTVLTNQNDANLLNNENCLSFNDDEQILNIFPNPAQNQLFILLQLSEEQNVVFSIIDITGKTIYQDYAFLKNEIHKLTFDIQSLTQGVYAIQIKTKKHTFVHKFIKN